MDHGAGWRLPSRDGMCVAVWDVKQRFGGSADQWFVCTFSMKVRSVSGGTRNLDAEPDILLCVSGLRVSRRELERLERALRGWLDLPLANLASTTLEARAQLGGKFDEPGVDVQLIGPEATIHYAVTLLSGTVEFPTDPSCIQILADGIRSSLAVRA